MIEARSSSSPLPWLLAWETECVQEERSSSSLSFRTRFALGKGPAWHSFGGQAMTPTDSGQALQSGKIQAVTSRNPCITSCCNVQYVGEAF